MTKIKSFFISIILILWLLPLSGQVPTPESFFGFKPGSDRHLFNYEQLISYLQQVEKNSSRVKLVQIGTSMMGRPIYMVLVSSPENIQNIDKLKKISRELAINPQIPEDTLKNFIKQGRVFLLMTLSMHSNEVGPSQALPLIVYQLATTTDPQMLSYLDSVVYMAVANHNPDGMDMVVEHYKKYLGTKYEGCRMPGVYHKYVGHDDNRDFVTLTQSETRAINRLYSKEWFPQVMVEKHQMGLTGPRYFVPPKHDPIAQNVDAELWTWDGVFGLNMQKDMTAAGLKGVTFNYVFDDYWPGSTETAHWKNMIAMLTECASVRYATPVYIEPNELSVSGKGLAEYDKSVKMPDPWPGGWWRLSDIVQYEITSTLSMIKTAALHKSELLSLRNRLCRKEVVKGQTQPPYYYIIPMKQHDLSEAVRLVRLLQNHGITVYRATMDMFASNYWINKGDVVVPLAQPFRSFIKEVMEKQTFPVRHYTKGGPMIKPYDITSWSLPLHTGVTAHEINFQIPVLEQNIEPVQEDFSIKKGIIPQNYKFAIFPANLNDSYKAAFKALSLNVKVFRTDEPVINQNDTLPTGSFIIPRTAKLSQITSDLDIDPVFVSHKPQIKYHQITMPRIALVETYFHDMDAGWTRFIFDTYGIKYTVLHPADIKTQDLSKFDVIVFPDNSPDVLLKGEYKWGNNAYSRPFYPPQYTKGMEEEGRKKLLKFIDNGGIILAWGRSVNLFKGQLKWSEQDKYALPFTDLSKSLAEKGLYIPGSLVRIKLRPGLLTLGMPQQTGVFYRGRPVLNTSLPQYDTDRRIIASFPGNDILMSGYGEKLNLIAKKPAIVWIRKNKGQLVLMSFNPQFRGSTAATFKLLFNSLLLPKNLTNPML